MPAPAYTPVSELQAALENVRTSTTLFPQPRDASVWPAWEAALDEAKRIAFETLRSDPETGEPPPGDPAAAVRSILDPKSDEQLRVAIEHMNSAPVRALLAQLDALAQDTAPILPPAKPSNQPPEAFSYEVRSKIRYASNYARHRLDLAARDRDADLAVRSLDTALAVVNIGAIAESDDRLMQVALHYAGTLRELELQVLESRWDEPALARFDRVLLARLPSPAQWRETVKAAIETDRLRFTSGAMSEGVTALQSERVLRASMHRLARRREEQMTSIILSQLPPDPAVLERRIDPDEGFAMVLKRRVDVSKVVALFTDSNALFAVTTRNSYLRSLGARVLIAIKRHQLRTGALPASLAEIPADLWSGSVPPLEAYEYRVNPDGTFHLAVKGPGKRSLKVFSPREAPVSPEQGGAERDQAE
jgi:hypothetical protein